MCGLFSKNMRKMTTGKSRKRKFMSRDSIKMRPLSKVKDYFSAGRKHFSISIIKNQTD
jgi:hypothetical protein